MKGIDNRKGTGGILAHISGLDRISAWVRNGVASLLALLTIVAMAGCGSADSGVVTLDFFQFKFEAADQFKAMTIPWSRSSIRAWCR